MSDTIPGAVAASATREHGQRIKAWIAEIRGYGPTVPIMAVEVRCNLPDCPPVETMTAAIVDRKTERKKLPKPIAEVTRDDVAAAWGQ